MSDLMMQSELVQLPLPDLSAISARMTWLQSGRGDQMPPDETDETWFMWLLMAGRGAGKTRAGAEDCWWFGYLNPMSRQAVIGPTSDDCRKVCFEGESGLIARCPPRLVANWNRGEKLLTMTNGSIIQGYSADEPDRLRGPQHNRAWCDELAAWRYLDATLDNLLMGLRLGTTPRIVATTTPRPIRRIKEIVADATTRVDTVSTYANRSNLPKLFLDTILRRYEGTRLGRQELQAEILTDNPGALWQRGEIDEDRVAGTWHDRRRVIVTDDGAIELQRIVVAVDPATTNREGSDEHGMVVVGRGTDGHCYVLEDVSESGTPDEWGRRAVAAYDRWGADRVVYEANQGGDMVAHTITSSAAAMRADGSRAVDFVPVTPVWASRGKVTRAEPVSALYEQHRIHHLGCHARLEDQMCEFTSDFDRDKMGYSPDRVDALVWAINELMLAENSGINVQDFYRQESGTHAARLAERASDGISSRPKGDMVALLPPAGVGSATGMMGTMYVVGDDGRMLVHASDAPPLVRAGYREAD